MRKCKHLFGNKIVNDSRYCLGCGQRVTKEDFTRYCSYTRALEDELYKMFMLDKKKGRVKTHYSTDLLSKEIKAKITKDYEHLTAH